MSFQDFHLRRDRREGVRIVVTEEFERTVREHHAETERGVGVVLFDHGDVGIRPPPLDQVGQIEAGRSGAGG